MVSMEVTKGQVEVFVGTAFARLNYSWGSSEYAGGGWKFRELGSYRSLRSDIPIQRPRRLRCCEVPVNGSIFITGADGLSNTVSEYLGTPRYPHRTY